MATLVIVSLTKLGFCGFSNHPPYQIPRGLLCQKKEPGVCNATIVVDSSEGAKDIAPIKFEVKYPATELEISWLPLVLILVIVILSVLTLFIVLRKGKKPKKKAVRKKKKKYIRKKVYPG